MEMTELSEIMTKKNIELSSLIEKYEYSEFGKDINKNFNTKLFNQLMEWGIGKDKISWFNKDDLEVVEFISFLRKCMGNEIILSGTIKKPSKGEIKGQKKELILSSPNTIGYLEMWANTMLNDQNGDYYNNSLEIKLKEKRKKKNPFTQKMDEDAFYIEPYSDEELDKIITYEKRNRDIKNSFSKNATFGLILYKWINSYSKIGMFKAQKTGQDTGKAFGVTKEYAFLYDCFVIIGLVNDLETNNKEKYTKVRDYLKSFDKAVRKNVDNGLQDYLPRF